MKITDHFEDVRRELFAIQAKLAEATSRRFPDLDLLQGQRDSVMLALLDNEGAHDRRFVPVR